MKKLSVTSQLLLVLITVVLLLSMAMVVFVNTRIQEDVNVHMDEEISIVLDSLDHAVEPLLSKDAYSDIEMFSRVLMSHEILLGVHLFDMEGNVLFSDTPEQFKDNTPGIVTDLIQSDKASDIRLVDNDLLCIASPLKYTDMSTGKEKSAILHTVIDFKYPESISASVTRDIIVSLSIITAILIIFQYIIVTRILGRPLKELTHAAEEISDYKYDYRIDLDGSKEFKDLADAFNTMAEKIQKKDEELDDARDIAEKASEARMDFLATMSHEIRTPLNAIIGFTDIMSEKVEDDEQQESLEIIQNSGKHLLTLINDVLDISKIESDNLELESVPFSIRDIIKEMTAMFQVNLSEDVELSYEIDVRAPAIYVGDAHRIRQVILNLISNAVKFTEVGQVIVIVEYLSPYTTIKVMDTGQGIPKSKQDEVFNAYKQTDNTITRNFGGTGLGLSITKKIVEVMGGQISLESEIGKGSTFTVKLPVESVLSSRETGRQMLERWICSDSTVSDITEDVVYSLPSRLEEMHTANKAKDYEKLEALAHNLKGVTGNFNIIELYDIVLPLQAYLHKGDIDPLIVDGYMAEIKALVSILPREKIQMKKEEVEKTEDAPFCVLVAEDIRENRLLVEKILDPLSVHLDFAEDGKETIEKLEAGYYDCLLLDIQMPILSGMDVLEWIRKQKSQSSVYIIVMTANAFAEDMEKYMNAGAHWFLSKPVNKKLLRSKMKGLIANKVDKNSVNRKTN